PPLFGAPAPPPPPPRPAPPPCHRHGRLLHRPAHRLLRRQRALPARMGPATPYHLLAPAQPCRHSTHLACATTLLAPRVWTVQPASTRTVPRRRCSFLRHQRRDLVAACPGMPVEIALE